MKILFKNTIAELQLVKDMNTAHYEFSHKLFELKRSKFFNPITQLSIMNDYLSNDYFLEVKSVIIANNKQTMLKHDYGEKVSFAEVL
jgi:hypothetical protein